MRPIAHYQIVEKLGEGAALFWKPGSVGVKSSEHYHDLWHGLHRDKVCWTKPQAAFWWEHATRGDDIQSRLAFDGSFGEAL